MRRLWEILYAAKADLVLNGHEHHYERFLPQDPSARADSSGLEEIIVGTGGGNLRGLKDTPAANSAYRIQGRFGVLKLSLGDSSYTHAFIDTEGRIWDPVQRKCH
jgi:hypothetical protein